MTRLPKKYFKSITDYVKTYYTAYGAKRAGKLYDAVKTVTKGFTRTDPVYVRIGDDGEPEIHYTFTSEIKESKFFALMDLGNAELHLHNGKFCSVIEQMFAGTTIRKIVLPDDFAPTDIAVMFNGCGVSEINSFSLTNVTLGWSVFAYAAKLTAIPDFDLSPISAFTGWFDGCSSLTAFRAKGMSASFDIHWSTKLTRDALLEVFNNLADLTGKTSATLTIGATLGAKITDEDRLIVTNKNWSLAE